MSEEYDLEGFEAVCPHCSSVFDLTSDVIRKGWDDATAEEYLKIECPDCGGIKLLDVIEE